jgi:hypothetical protein
MLTKDLVTKSQIFFMHLRDLVLCTWPLNCPLDYLSLYNSNTDAYLELVEKVKQKKKILYILEIYAPKV